MTQASFCGHFFQLTFDNNFLTAMRLERSQWEELEKRIRHDFLLQDPRIRFYNDKGIFVVTSHIF